jgi:integrase
MPKIKLTKKVVERIKAPHRASKNKEPVIYWDTETKGFGLWVSGKSNQKRFIAQRDLPKSGNTRRVTIGAVGEIDLEKAREKAHQINQQIRSGVDPKARSNSAMTLGGALELYLERRQLAENSRRSYRGKITCWLHDWLDKPLGTVTGNMVEERYHEIAKQSPSTAAVCMTVFSSLYRFAARRDPSMPANPTQWLDGQRIPIPARDTKVGGNRMGKFYMAVMQLENEIHRDYVLTLLFTGMRRGEVASLTWDRVDFTERTINVPAPKTKNKRPLVLPMNTFVFKLLKARRALGDARFVFPEPRSRTGHINGRHVFEPIVKAIGFNVRAHDLRRDYAQATRAARIHPYDIKGLMNHAAGGDVTFGHYAAPQTEDLRKPAQEVCDQLKAWCHIK